MMLTVLAVMFAMPMGAQTPATAPTCKVTGTVMDKETGEPEMMATVCVAHKSLPGTGVKKVLADSVGRFEVVVPVMPGQYTVTAAMVGRVAEPRRFALTEGQEVMDIGAVYVADDVKMLKEVTVDAQKPLVTMDVDKLTYDVASDPDAKILRLSEMMGKVPLISVDGDGNIEMNGTKKFLILQNGRKTAVTRNPKEVLRSLPAEMVKSIEVITSPGARYDAEGIGGVINIVMRSQYEGHLTTLSADAGTTAYNGSVMTMSKIGRFAFDAILQPHTGARGQDVAAAQWLRRGWRHPTQEREQHQTAGQHRVCLGQRQLRDRQRADDHLLADGYGCPTTHDE